VFRKVELRVNSGGPAGPDLVWLATHVLMTDVSGGRLEMIDVGKMGRHQVIEGSKLGVCILWEYLWVLGVDLLTGIKRLESVLGIHIRRGSTPHWAVI
jgi:hypothetical protein